MHKGFTLIELLLVVVIIGIVAAFVLPKFGDVKEKAYVSAMKNDLRNTATEQEIYFEENSDYMDATQLGNVATSDGVTLTYPADADIDGISSNPTSDGYVLRAEHNSLNTASPDFEQCLLNRTNGTVSAFNHDIESGQMWCRLID